MTELVDFTNNIGQVISPGDDVVVITNTYKRIHICRGVYLGLKNGKVQARVPTNKWAYFVKGSDERAPVGFHTPLLSSGFNWRSAEYAVLKATLYNPYEYRQYKDTRVTTLQNNLVFKLA